MQNNCQKNSNSLKLTFEYKSQKPKNFSLLKYISLFILFFLFLFTLIFFSYTKLYQQKQLSSQRNLSNNSNSNIEKNEKKSFFPIVVLLFYITFILMSLYMIIIMRIISQKTESLRLEVYKFMYMANNGYLFVSAIDSMISGSGIIITCLVFSILIFVTGTIIYIVIFIKVIIHDFFDIYFSFKILCLWYTLPFKYVWPFLGLTDPCCLRTTYTVTIYSDGTVTDDRFCVILTNKMIFLIKRLAMLTSTLLYYLFLAMITIIWLFIKLIILIVDKIKESCKKNSNQIQNGTPGNVQVNGNEIVNNNVVTNNNLNMNFKRNKTYIKKNTNNNINPNGGTDNGQVINITKNRKGKFKKRKTEVLKSNININRVDQEDIKENENNMNQAIDKPENIKIDDNNINKKNKITKINSNEPLSNGNIQNNMESEDGLNEKYTII